MVESEGLDAAWVLLVVELDQLVDSADAHAIEAGQTSLRREVALDQGGTHGWVGHEARDVVARDDGRRGDHELGWRGDRTSGNVRTGDDVRLLLPDELDVGPHTRAEGLDGLLDGMGIVGDDHNQVRVFGTVGVVSGELVHQLDAGELGDLRVQIRGRGIGTENEHHVFH